MNLKRGRQETRISITSHAALPLEFVFEPLDRVGKLDTDWGGDISDINTTVHISGNLGGYNFVLVVSQIKVQMRKEISTSISLNFIDNKVIFRRISNVSPHGQILNKHFKKVIVLNGMLEFHQFVWLQGRLAQETPIDGIAKGNFVRRRFAAIAHEGFTHAKFVADGRFVFEATNGGQFHVFIFGSLVFFFLRRMGLAEREGVVTVGFCRVVEGTVIVF
mmetsp:Transcript_10594/g.17533  ORF Transcript_10594/g.17533 Transcript_10594/m.17533 type:complete len:219 (-) Transcript_10594:650-1306(-)